MSHTILKFGDLDQISILCLQGQTGLQTSKIFNLNCLTLNCLNYTFQFKLVIDYLPISFSDGFEYW